MSDNTTDTDTDTRPSSNTRVQKGKIEVSKDQVNPVPMVNADQAAHVNPKGDNTQMTQETQAGIQKTQDPQNIVVSRKDWENVHRSNESALIMTMQAIEAMDEILDECSKFEDYVRKKKIAIKDMWKKATSPPPGAPSQ